MGSTNSGRKALAWLSGAAAFLTLSACGGGGGSDGPAGPVGPPGPAGPPAPTAIGDYDPLPGVNVVITSLAGGTGAGGNFVAGNVMTVTFTVKDDAGNDIDFADLVRLDFSVSGPTNNYQRVIASANRLSSAASLGGGLWSVTLPAIPTAYLPPLNDSPAIPTDTLHADPFGEWQGLPLDSGTYSVGIRSYREIEFRGDTYRDVGVDVRDFLFGTATTLVPRRVVQNDNCNVCHTELRAHDNGRKDVRLCVLCHTAGAEDGNGPPDPTPGTSIAFRTMIHRIHNGAHLPSVNGVTTNPDGSRNYGATPVPLEFADGAVVEEDFSDVNFPVFPNYNIAMPRDAGYSALSSAAKTQEGKILTGVTMCAKCHGDPDGAGPLTAPADGGNHESKPSRQACGACHDDIVWSNPYTANGQTMLANFTNDACTSCHFVTGGATPDPLSIRDAHLHPLVNPAINPGLNIHVSTVTNATGGGVGVGDVVRATFTATNDAGTPVALSDAGLTSFTAVVSGPTTNSNMLLFNMSIPNTAFAAGTGPWTMNVPMNVALELMGPSTANPGDTFVTTYPTHWNLKGTGTNTVDCRTHVFVRTDAGASPDTALLLAAASAGQSWLDVDPTLYDVDAMFKPATALPAAWSNYLVVEDGTANREYVRVRSADKARGRIWLDTGATYPVASGTTLAIPQGRGLRNAHAAGVRIREVTLAEKTITTDWTLNVAQPGSIAEVGNAYPDGKDVLVNYTTDFVMPAAYPAPYNDSPDIGEEVGKWKGKALLPGTYRLGLYGYFNRVVTLYGETQTYRGTSEPEWGYFLVGGATDLEPFRYTIGHDTCNRCHNDLYWHGGGRHGFQACNLCHGTAALEDNPSTASPQPLVVNASFRVMIHKIHMGENLPDHDTYAFAVDGEFPAMPGGVKQCVKCHGDPPEPPTQPWKGPSPDHSYPGSSVAARMWSLVCGSCHSGDDAQAHINSNVSGTGVEACEVCHGVGKIEAVEKVHFVR